MRNRSFRPIAATLSILILTGVPAHAGSIAISEVVQVMSSYQNPPDLRLRSVSQDSGIKSSLQSGTSNGSRNNVLFGSQGENISDSLLSGVAVGSDQQGGVQVIDLGDVEGTVCDCGEILIAGGGFPKWPLLFLAAIPLFFIHGSDDSDDDTPDTPDTPNTTFPTPTPTPPSPPGEIPEPASLLLFGTGLAAFGAGLRRRYAKGKLAAQIQATEED